MYLDSMHAGFDQQNIGHGYFVVEIVIRGDVLETFHHRAVEIFYILERRL
jgi:hypothetical protein